MSDVSSLVDSDMSDLENDATRVTVPKPPSRILGLMTWALPASSVKNRLLRRLGHTIGDNVVIGPTLVLACGTFVLADGVSVGTGNVFRRLRRVDIGRNGAIGNFNLVSASPEYQRFDGRAGVLRMSEESIMTNRHYLDCSGIVELRRRSMLGGVRSILQSHEIDIVTNRTTIGVIVIGERSFVGTGCMLLKNAHVPSESLIAAGSVVLARRSTDDLKAGIYAGNPARWKSTLHGSAWWDRATLHTLPESALDFDVSFE